MVDMYCSRSSPRATPTTTCWPTIWASTTSPASWARWGWARRPESTSKASRRACCRRRKKRRFKRPEQQKWFAAGRDHLDRHRPGLQRLHADPAGAGGRQRGQQRRGYRPHLVRYITDSRTGEKTLIEPAVAHHALEAAEHRHHQERDGRRSSTAKDVRAFAGAEYVSGGKTGRRRCSASRGPSTRAASSSRNCATTDCSSPSRRPRTEDRARRAGRERRLRRPGGGADRTHGHRLLPAGQAAQGPGSGRRSRGRGAIGHVTDPAAPHAATLARASRRLAAGHQPGADGLSGWPPSTARPTTPTTARSASCSTCSSVWRRCGRWPRFRRKS